MACLIVKSGVKLINKMCSWNNIYLKEMTSNNLWEYAIVKIYVKNINTILPTPYLQKDKIHKIEFEIIQNKPSLLVNDMIVYQNKYLFDFELIIKLIQDQPIDNIVTKEIKKCNYYRYDSSHHIEEELNYRIRN